MNVRLLGRSSSHYTRVALIFAHDLGLSFEFAPVHDLTEMSPSVYDGNPALKLPVLCRDGAQLFGTENICRALAELSTNKRRIVWPEALTSDVSRNAQELVWHGMSAQVQLIFGTRLGKLPVDNIYFTKGRAGFEGALRWLDAHLHEALAALPEARDLSLFEVTLFCLIEHLTFRETLPADPYPSLVAFAHKFAERDVAKRTAYRLDAPPSPDVRA